MPRQHRLVVVFSRSLLKPDSFRRRMSLSMEKPARYNLGKNVVAMPPTKALRLDGERPPYGTSSTCSSQRAATRRQRKVVSLPSGLTAPDSSNPPD